MDEQAPHIYINGDGNVIGDGNIVTITKQYFTGEYERLRDAYIDPSQVFDRVDLDHFVGREWLLAEVDAFLRDHDRGYFILEAEAGLGKTTFLAWLVRQRGYIQHFVELAPGLDGVGCGLRNLAAQVVLAFHLREWEAGGVLPGTATRSDFLYRLLKLAASQLVNGQKMILVIDALDEAGIPPGQNALSLPRVLPQGIFVIVSQRPVSTALQVDTNTTPRRVLKLGAKSKENQSDMRRFLESAATWPGIAKALGDSGCGGEQFVRLLIEKCHGVWVYLHYVIHEIEDGKRAPLDLAKLPDGMTQYYARHWECWRDANAPQWYTTHLPLLATLAALQEPVTISQLCSLAAIPEQPELARLLGERWRPFLTTNPSTDGDRYGLYHASLRDFMGGAYDHTTLTEADLQFAVELAAATQQAHARIADRYLNTWGGMRAKLQGLHQLEKRDLDGGYGLRHLAGHLEKAGRLDDLHHLLVQEWIEQITEEYPRKLEGFRQRLYRILRMQRLSPQYRYHNVWHNAQESSGKTDSYLHDVKRAWRLAGVAYGTGDTKEQSKAIGMQCRYALIVSSVNSLAQNMPPALLAMLIGRGVWTPFQAMAYVAQLSDDRAQAKGLEAIIPYLPATFISEAREMVLRLSDAQSRAEALLSVVPFTPEQERLGLLKLVETSARQIADLRTRDQVLSQVSKLSSETDRVQAAQTEEMTKIQETAPQLQSRKLLNRETEVPAAEGWAFLEALDMQNGSLRADALAGFAEYAPDILLTKAVTSVRAICDSNLQTKAQASLVPHMLDDALQDVVKIAREGKWQGLHQVDKLARLTDLMFRTFFSSGRWTVYPLLEKYADVIASDVGGTDYADYRFDLMMALIPRLKVNARAATLGRWLGVARKIEPVLRKLNKSKRLLDLLNVWLPDTWVYWVLDAAEKACRSLTVEEARIVGKLTESMSCLPQNGTARLRRNALQSIRAVHDTELRSELLVSFAWHLSDSEREALMEEVLALILNFHDHERKAQALAHVLTIPLTDTACGAYLRKVFDATAEANWQDHAITLARLVSLVPEHLVGRAFEAAKGIEPSGCRAIALLGLLPRLPSRYGHHIVQQAVSTLQELDNRQLSSLLSDLAVRLVKAGYLIQGFELLRLIQESALRLQALIAIVPDLPDVLVRQARDEAVNITRNFQRKNDNGFASLMTVESSVKNADKVLLELLGMMWDMCRYDSDRSRVLANLVPFLPEPLLDGVQRKADEFRRIEDRLRVLMPIACRLTGEKRQEILAGILAILQITENDDLRADTLSSLAPYVHGSLYGDALSIACAISNKKSRASALGALVPQLVKLPELDLYQLWNKYLPVLSSRGRPDILIDLCELSPVIAKLGGAQAVTETFHAIRDVGRWWP